MTLQLDVGEPVGGCKLVSVAGDVDPEAVPEFEQAIRRLLRDRPEAIIVDVTQTDHMCAAGLDVLLACAANLNVMGSTMVLVGARPAMSMLAQWVGLFDLGRSAATVSEAVRKLFGTQPVHCSAV
jgi:anti-anti-sigma factor